MAGWGAAGPGAAPRRRGGAGASGARALAEGGRRAGELSAALAHAQRGPGPRYIATWRRRQLRSAARAAAAEVRGGGGRRSCRWGQGAAVVAASVVVMIEAEVAAVLTMVVEVAAVLMMVMLVVGGGSGGGGGTGRASAGVRGAVAVVWRGAAAGSGSGEAGCPPGHRFRGRRAEESQGGGCRRAAPSSAAVPSRPGQRGLRGAAVRGDGWSGHCRRQAARRAGVAAGARHRLTPTPPPAPGHPAVESPLRVAGGGLPGFGGRRARWGRGSRPSRLAG